MVQLQSKHNHEGQNMKHKLVVAVSVLSIIVCAGVSVVAYQHFRVWRNGQAATAIKNNAAMQRATLAQQVRFNRGLDQLKAQCSRDHQTYAAMTPAQRVAKGATQDCDPAAIQLVQ